MRLEPAGSVVHKRGLGTVHGVVMGFTEAAPDENTGASKNANKCRSTEPVNEVDQQVREHF